jgi:hypothetical protein
MTCIWICDSAVLGLDSIGAASPKVSHNLTAQVAIGKEIAEATAPFRPRRRLGANRELARPAVAKEADFASSALCSERVEPIFSRRYF